MSELIREIALGFRDVYIPNRYSTPFVCAWQELTGLEVPDLTNRKEQVTSSGVTYTKASGRDIPMLVDRDKDKSNLSIGLTGEEWWLNYAGLFCSGVSDKTLPIQYKRIDGSNLGELAVVAQEGVEFDNLRSVVTSYPGISINGLTNSVIVNGATEAIGIRNKIPAVALVSSGNTVAENNLRVLEVLMNVSVVLVYPRVRTQTTCELNGGEYAA